MAQANTEKEVREQRLKANAVKKQQLSDLKKILNMPGGEGIRYMRRLLSECYMFKSTFTGNSQGSLNEGKRVVGLWVVEDITQTKAYEELSQILINREAMNNG